jgi:hypothetical protein
VEIVLFGLAASFLNLGLGGYFLSQALESAWAWDGTKRVWLHTCESDDLMSWTNRRLAMGYGPEGGFDHGGVVLGAYLYESYDIKDGLSWGRAKDEPILSVHQEDCGAWEKSCIYMPWLVEHEGRYYNEKFSSDGKVFRDGDHWVNFFFGVGKGGAHVMVAFSRDLTHWTVDPEPLYKAGGNPSGLDKQFAHKISLVWNPVNETYYLFYNAVGNMGRGIGLITSKPLGGR